MNPVDSDLKITPKEDLVKAIEDELKEGAAELTVAELLNVKPKPST